MNLNEWAIKWNIPFNAVQDLRVQMGVLEVGITQKRDGSEAAVQASERLKASQMGARLWRNNVGAAHTPEGGFIRWGLANESKAMNDKIKSSDLIGINPIAILPGHVGSVIGQFVARETKRENWTYTANKHELAQLAFIELVNSLGGDAKFVNTVGIV